MYKLRVTPQAKKQLRLITKLVRRNAIDVVFEELKQYPYLGKPLTRELTGRHVWKLGVYRVIYVINKTDKTVKIIAAGHRSVVYQ